MICEGPTADELCSVGWCIYVFNLDFTHLCLDIPVPSINKDFIIIIIIIIINIKLIFFCTRIYFIIDSSMDSSTSATQNSPLKTWMPMSVVVTFHQ